MTLTEHPEHIPVAEEYLRALGRATYNFAYLEWAIIWLTETMRPGFLRGASNKTAGDISGCFSSAVESLENTNASKVRLQALASEFSQIVYDRNSLMHGNPHTAQTGEQRLFYDGRHGRSDWTIELMTRFSARTATAAAEAVDLLHNGCL